MRDGNNRSHVAAGRPDGGRFERERHGNDDSDLTGPPIAARPPLPDLKLFPSLKARQLLHILEHSGYRPRPGRGKPTSHRKLDCPGRPTIVFAFHDKVTIRANTVRDVLCKQACLDEHEVKELLGRR